MCNLGFYKWLIIRVGFSFETRSFRSSGDLRSRSAAELLLTQKTKLPCLHDGLLKENPDTDALVVYLGLTLKPIAYRLLPIAWFNHDR